MEPKPKILYIDTLFPTIGTFIAAEIVRMKRRGAQVFIYPLMNKQFPERSRDYDEIMDDIVYTPYFFSWELWRAWAYHLTHRPVQTLAVVAECLVKHLREPERFVKLLASLPKLGLIARRAQQQQVDLVHGTWGHYPATAAYIISHMTDIPYSFSAHASADIHVTKLMLREKLLCARFVLMCTASNVEYLKQLAPEVAERIHLCYHGINLERFQFKEQTPKKSNEPPLVVSVGRLRDVKGFHIMIDAVAQLREQGHTVRYLIIGGGEEQASLTQQIARLGLQEFVTIQGYVSQDRLKEFYADAAMFAMPSILGKDGSREGVPNAIVEAMAMGIPVVATRIGGIPEVVLDGKTGVLVEPGNAVALTRAVTDILQWTPDERQRILHNARMHVEEMFDVERNFGVVYETFMRAIEMSRTRTVE